MLKRLNWVHVATILALPIVLALINPNWLFNANIADDYIYLGYQLNFPNYVGWSPSEGTYFIERISWILPGYLIRQIFSPLMANFIIHLGVYYLASFSVYATLNRLFNAKVALIITLLFGQYPPILRSVGWDYVDGYAMALIALTIFLLTWAVGAKRQSLYLIGAGIIFALAVNANTFNALYTPALALYYLFLNDWRGNTIGKLFRTGVYTAIGGIGTTGFLALVYYLFTQNILYANSMQMVGDYSLSHWSYYFLSTYGKFTHPHWMFLFVAVSCLIIFRPMIWKRATTMPSENPYIPNYRVILRAMTGLFAGMLLVMGIFQFNGYALSRLSLYNTNIMLGAFLFLGAIFAPHLTNTPQRLGRYAPLMAFFIPMLPLILFSLSPSTFYITNHYVLYIGAIICIVLACFPKWTLIGLVGFCMLIGRMFNESREYNSWIYPPYQDVYVADRYMLQDMYVHTMTIAQIINNRYDDFSLERFRLFYDQGEEPHSRLFNSVSGVYLWAGYRLFRFDNVVEDSKNVAELVFLSSVNRTEALLAQLQELIEVVPIESHRISTSRGDIDLIFFQIIQVDEP
jgi:hypothetical protein